MSTLLHVSGHRSSEGFSFLGGDIKGDRNVVQVCSMSILFPPLSPKMCRVPRVKVTQLDQGEQRGLHWWRQRLRLLDKELIGSISFQIPFRDETGSFLGSDPEGLVLEPLQPAGDGLLDSWWRALIHGL